MGFFFVEQRRASADLGGLTPEFLRRHGCAVCPLDQAVGLKHSKMLPTGAKQPQILIIGEAPGAAEDARGEQFVGKTGKILRYRIPDEWIDKIRFTNSIRCRPPENRTPTNVELASCAPLFEADVAATKPRVIAGFGAIPLFQVCKQTGISIWRGRRMPVEVGGHACWYYPMFHPSYISHLITQKKRSWDPKSLDDYAVDEEFAFALDLKRMFADIDSLPDPIIHSEQDATSIIEIVDDVDRAAQLFKEVANDSTTGVDIETNGLRPYVKGSKILSIGLSGKNATFAVGLDHSQTRWTVTERKRLDFLVDKFLYEAKCRKIAHHSPFEMEWFAYFYGKGIVYAGRWDDSESQAYILDPRRGGLSLDFLCRQYFGLDLKAISGLDRKNLDKVPLRQVLKYNALDAKYHRLLYLAQAKRVKDEGMSEVYEHQMRRIPALVLTQMHGVPVDLKVNEKFQKKYEARAAKAGKEIAQDETVKQFESEKGRVFNPSSVPDVNYLVKNILNIDIATSDKGELAQIEHPIARSIIDWRESNKNLSTYIYSIGPDSPHLYEGNVLHPIISTTRVISWRSSSDSPNIQNYPKRDEELKEVRGQVKSGDPNVMVVSFDYAGIQARGVAQESKDKKLVEAFWNNYDIHSDWRDRIAKKVPGWIKKGDSKDKDKMKHYRYLAKNKFVFPAFFGAQAYNLSGGLGIPERDAGDLREEFFDEFPEIEKWHIDLHKLYYEHGYVTGLSGFRRPAPVSVNERINTPIQSDEAIIVLDALARLSELGDDRYQAALEVHDDITFLWPKNEIERRAEVVVKALLDVPFEWAKIVPMEVEMLVGPDWINQKEVGKFSSDKWNGVVELKRD